tara:strand:- start:57 stop:545 length:489 start_codon:yes stop_codon:yes gene_type:complete
MIAILVFSLIILSTICLWLLIEGRKNPKFLIWFIPILLILVSSTYVTYTSILGYPKVATPEQGVYLEHFIDEPNWIYLWVVGSDRIPKSYQIVYTREIHDSLEGVKAEAAQGKFMVIGKSKIEDNSGIELGEVGKNSANGYTIGGDINIYEWDHTTSLPSKE